MVKRNRNGKGNQAFPKHLMVQTADLTDHLMKLCLETTVTSHTATTAFENFYDIVQRLCALQQDWCLLRKLEASIGDRTNRLYDLLNDLGEQLSESVEPTTHSLEGHGLSAKRFIQVGDCVLKIPAHCILYLPESIANPVLRIFIKDDPIASQMENVALSLYLLSEMSLGEKSKHYKYLVSLPSKYSTLAYLSPECIHALKGSSAVETAVSNYQNICRQYAYFQKKWRCLSPNDRLSIFSTFCFDDYRWAVSTVMSRNNMIPLPKRKATLCLIPVWDLLNHNSGQITTDFDVERNELVYYAMENYFPGEQIYMDYGPRTSCEFLLFSGFTPDYNPHNKVVIKLGVSQSDKLYALRCSLLNRLGFTSPLQCEISASDYCPFSLVAFGRIFVMLKDELEHYLQSPDSMLDYLKSCSFASRNRIDSAACAFLVQRLQLLISSYRNLPDEISENNNRSLSLKDYCHRLCTQEISLLRKTLKFLLARSI